MKAATKSLRATVVSEDRLCNLAAEVSHIAQLAEIAAGGGLYFDALDHLEALRSLLSRQLFPVRPETRAGARS